jgi:hypothetical protein
MAKAKAKAIDSGETVSGYFRKVFAEKPGLLEGRSNQELLDRWLKDHPGETKVPENVKKNLQNVKSVLRKQRRKRKGGRPKKTAAPVAAAAGTVIQGAAPKAARVIAAQAKGGGSGLELLEEQIDDCMVAAKKLDSEGLHDVIAHLRRARNLVVWKQGE